VLDDADLRELRALFLVDAPQRIARLELDLEEIDAAETGPTRRAAAAAGAREAHSLQGAAGTAGLDALADLAEQLHEALGRDADTGAPDLLRTIKAELAGVEEQQRGGAAAAVTVLHVEDNPLNARLVERVLNRRADVRLLAASDGETALRLARERLPELILLDLNLPGLSGAEVLSRLRADPETRGLAVVVVTAHEPGRTSERLRGLGILECLPKPVDVGRLLDLVDEAAAASPRGPG
jgi:hypothetical protein